MAGPRVAYVGAEQGVCFSLAGTEVAALAEGGLWIAAARTLVVSDLHLEKGSSFARRGQLLPPYDTRETLQRLAGLAQRLQPACIVSLGDSFHDRTAAQRLCEADAETVRALTRAYDFVWIEGNHDPQPPADLGGRAAHDIVISGLVLRHEPTGQAGEVAGHLHPAAAVSGRGRRVRARCFATDGVRLVMPAFGAYTGGLNVCDAAFAPMFPDGCDALMLARGRIFPAPAARLLPDAG
jgi:DNA ligase-associated metallophosphoesterase